MKRFTELRIVETAGSIAGAYAAKLFADFGATVIKVEPPGGDPMRFAGHLDSKGLSFLFRYLNTGKSSVVLDHAQAYGEQLLSELCATADAIIESSSPDPLLPLPDKITRQPGAIRLRISPFGMSGPSAGQRSTPFTDFAVSGHMYLTGEPDREPLQGAGPQSLYASGTHGVIGVLAALLARERSGHGQDIDVSHFEVMTTLHQWTTVRYTHGGVIQERAGNKYGSLHPSTIYEAADGWVAFAAVGNESLGRFLAVIGMEELLDDPRFATGGQRFINAEAFDAIFGEWIKHRPVRDIVSLAQEVRAPAAPVNSLLDLLDDVHLRERGFWREASGEADGIRFPGPPFRMSAHEWSLRAAPPMGTVAAESEAQGRLK